MRIVLAEPRGFCAGVQRAVEIVELALERFGAPVFVRHEIVHNRHVVEGLRAQGAVFVEEVEEVPVGAVAVFSAHGVSRRVEADARGRGLRVIDATCPLVGKVHKEGRRYAREGREVVLVGHAGHPEVDGTLGQIDGRVHLVGSVEDVAALEVEPGVPLAYVTQTTLSVDDTRGIIAALGARFPGIVGPDTRDICYATQNRQRAVRALAAVADAILVIGSKNSSNSNRLREIGEGLGVPSHLIDDAGDLDPAWVRGRPVLGVTAGASAPEVLVEGLLERLKGMGYGTVERLVEVEEGVVFGLPRELAGPAGAAPAPALGRAAR